MSEPRPLSELMAQGWELRLYHPVLGPSGLMEHAFHLQRSRDNKLLVVRRKLMGEGLHIEELDV